MFRQDYIMRLIEQFARVLATLLHRIRGRQVSAEVARTEIAAIARQCGLDLDVARGLDSTMLRMWLAPRGEIDPGRFWLMGELLLIEGIQSREEGASAAARADLQRALTVFSEIDPAWRPQPDLPSAGERVSEIRQALDESSSPAEPA